MNKDGICQGWIYFIKNKINGKMYIGQTCNYERRKYQHFNCEEIKSLKEAFLEYGIQNFEINPILTFKAINYETTRKILCWFEEFYIQKFDTFENGYNATLGGLGAKNIYRHNPNYTQKITDKDKNKGTNKRPILMYSLDGRLLREFPTVEKAAEELKKYKRCSDDLKTIKTTLNPKRKGIIAYSYFWIYKKNRVLESINVNKSLKKLDRPVYFYNKDGILVASYKSIEDAESYTGRNDIRICCSHTKLKKVTKRYRGYWSWEGPTENNTISR